MSNTRPFLTNSYFCIPLAGVVCTWRLSLSTRHVLHRELRNHLFRQTVVKSRLARVEKSRMLARTAVQVDIPDFEARSKEAARAGDYSIRAGRGEMHVESVALQPSANVEPCKIN